MWDQGGPFQLYTDQYTATVILLCPCVLILWQFEGEPAQILNSCHPVESCLPDWRELKVLVPVSGYSGMLVKLPLRPAETDSDIHNTGNGLGINPTVVTVFCI
jgi:hypothetical protein